LYQQVADSGRLDRSGQHGQSHRVGRQLAKQFVACAAADDVHDIDPLTGQKIQPHLITLRATREKFTTLILDEPKFNPVECVRRYFFADISPHPDELIPVEPVMPFSMADPRIVDPIDVISDIDKRPNLLELAPKEFEAFIQNLFTKMGFDTKLYQASGDGGIDCVPTTRTPSRAASSSSRPSCTPAPSSQPTSATCGAPCSTRAPPKGS